MSAEAKGKISQTGKDLDWILGINLTWSFFGPLRYIPFHLVLRNILVNGIYPKEVGELFQGIDAEFWGDKVKFLPYGAEGEIDALIEFDQVIIGIDVKYMNQSSADDEAAAEKIMKIEAEQSCNMLARESRVLSEKGKGKTKVLLFLADNASCRKVYEDAVKDGIIADDVLLGHLSWKTVYYLMQGMKLENPFYQLIIEDIKSLLIKKGFESFQNMFITLDEDIDPDGFYNFGTIN